MKVMIAFLIVVASTPTFADCVTNALGKKVCSNGQSAVAVNPNTGKVATANKAPNGVTTTQTNHGATAKTKNGAGVVQGPNGTTCAKGKATKAGCRP
jgi:hypothetical protein